ncbi:MAG: 50S ribosomal protein L29 [Patescibacteria group bacterium]
MSSYKELQEKNDKDLIKLLSEKRTALRNFRFGVAGSKIRNVKEGVAIEKEIARILTALQTKKS